MPLMIFFIVTLISLSFTGLIVLLVQKKQWFLFRQDLDGVQKFHINHTSRIGGIPVFISFFAGLWLTLGTSEWWLFLLLATLPVFLGGLIEDIVACVSPYKRLLTTFLSIIITFFVLDIKIDNLGFDWIDQILFTYTIITLLFTMLAVATVVNSLNIIDGFNGILGGYSILVCLAISYVAYILGDTLILQINSIIIASILGFFVFNFPLGKIFIGDGGAYFIGFIMSIIGLMLGIRNEEITHWFILLLFIYPLYELVFSIYRRMIVHKVEATQPDANHLHSLVYLKLISYDRFRNNKVICNSAVSPFMWLLSLMGIIPAVVWFDNQIVLIVWAFVFMFIYTTVYKYLSLSVTNPVYTKKS